MFVVKCENGEMYIEGEYGGGGKIWVLREGGGG